MVHSVRAGRATSSTQATATTLRDYAHSELDALAQIVREHLLRALRPDADPCRAQLGTAPGRQQLRLFPCCHQRFQPLGFVLDETLALLFDATHAQSREAGPSAMAATSRWQAEPARVLAHGVQLGGAAAERTLVCTKSSAFSLAITSARSTSFSSST